MRSNAIKYILRMQGDVAWLTTKFLLLFLGGMCLVSFLATLRTPFFITFAVIVTAIWFLFYRLFELLKQKYVTERMHVR